MIARAVKNVVFLFLFLPVAARGHAQFYDRPRVIYGINIVDEQGKGLLGGRPDSVTLNFSPSDIEHSANHPPGMNNFAEVRKFDEETGFINMINYFGRPAIVHPALRPYFLLSGPVKDIIAERVIGYKSEIMRIILLNNGSRTDSSRFTTYLIDNIPFRKGTYELDCSRIASFRDLAYDSLLQLRLFTIKPELKRRTRISVPRTALLNYDLDDYHLFPNGTFRYLNNNDLGGAVIGRGIYRATRHSVTFTYQTIPVSHTGVTEELIAPDSAYVLDLEITDRDGRPAPFVSIGIGGTKVQVLADADGKAQLTLKGQSGPITVVMTAARYLEKKKVVPVPGHYRIRCVMEPRAFYIEGGAVRKLVITDYEPDCIGIYWVKPGEHFDFDNQEQMEERRFFLSKRFKPRPRAVIQ